MFMGSKFNSICLIFNFQFINRKIGQIIIIICLKKILCLLINCLLGIGICGRRYGKNRYTFVLLDGLMMMQRKEKMSYLGDLGNQSEHVRNINKYN